MAAGGRADLSGRDSADLAVDAAAAQPGETPSRAPAGRPPWWSVRRAGLLQGGLLWFGAIAWAAFTAPGTQYIWADHFAHRLLLAVPVAAISPPVLAGVDLVLFRRAFDALRVGLYVLLFPVWFTLESLVRVGRTEQWMLFPVRPAGRGPLDPIDYDS